MPLLKYNFEIIRGTSAHLDEKGNKRIYWYTLTFVIITNFINICQKSAAFKIKMSQFLRVSRYLHTCNSIHTKADKTRRYQVPIVFTHISLMQDKCHADN